MHRRRIVRVSAIFELLVTCTLGLAPCIAEQSAPREPGPPLSPAQLDSLTAPIALYPDALIAQMLTAATYPLEVVEAAHWLDNSSNASLRGDALAAALEHEDWDLSVKSLVPFPDTLRMMERDLQWTEQIGNAFLAQQADVMDSIQRLRKHAVSAGTLKSTPQQTVWNQEEQIVVEPVNPDVVYVPYYDPAVAFGPWPWPGYAPFAFVPPPGIYISGPAIVFGVGFGVIRPLWGWSYWSWPRHGLFIPPHGPHTWPLRPGPWRHDPNHRREVPYRDRGPVHGQHPFPPGRPARPPAVPPGHLPPSDERGRGREPPGHKPGIPPGTGQPPRDDRSGNRPPPAHPRFPTGPSTKSVPPSGRLTQDGPPLAGSAPRAQPRALPGRFGASGGGQTDGPSRNAAPQNRSAAPLGGAPPRKPQ